MAAIVTQGAMVGLDLVRARDDLQAGRFDAAQAEFNQARDDLQHSWLLAPMHLIPPVQRQIDALALVADIGAHGAHAAMMGIRAVGTRDLAQLPAVESDLKSMTEDRSRVPRSGLVPQIREAVSQVDTHLQQAQEALSLLPMIRQLLGQDGSASYLVLQQDPAELRATGGFIGSVAFLEFDHGKMRPFQPVDIEAIDGPHHQRTLGTVGSPKFVEPPRPFFRVLDPGDSWELRDENFSPDFPSSARLAEFLLQRETGRKVQGVIAIDPYLISDLLSVTGPVKVPETGDLLTAQNFYELTLRSVELHRGSTPRKSFLSYATNAVFDRLKKLPAHSWLRVAKLIQDACLTKNVQAYFDSAAAEALIDRYSCAGKVPVFKGDGLMVVDENLNSNKDDFWISRSYHLDIAVRPDGSARHTLRIDYGAYPQLEQLTTPYINWLRLYLPSGARLSSAQGMTAEQSSDLGNVVIQGWVQYDFGQTHDITIVYDVPARMMSAGSLQLTWLKQAGRRSDPVLVEVSRQDGQKISAMSGLERDRVFLSTTYSR